MKWVKHFSQYFAIKYLTYIQGHINNHLNKWTVFWQTRHQAQRWRESLLTRQTFTRVICIGVGCFPKNGSVTSVHHHVTVSVICTAAQWRCPSFLTSGMPIGVVLIKMVITTDASPCEVGHHSQRQSSKWCLGEVLCAPTWLELDLRLILLVIIWPGNTSSST